MKKFDIDNHAIEELLAAWHAGAAEDAGCPEKIVALTMPAVERVLAKTYPSFGDCYPEMVESAAREIWRNALSYDLDGDEPFSMFITPFIRAGIHAYASKLPTTQTFGDLSPRERKRAGHDYGVGRCQQ